MPQKLTQAANNGLTIENIDVKIDYTAEVAAAMHKVIAKAWSDATYKASVIANPRAALAVHGVYYPDHYDVQMYDDPTAKVGQWSLIGKNQTSILRIPIPPAPPNNVVSSDDLKALQAAADDCCCCCGLCTCTGAVSNDTWY